MRRRAASPDLSRSVGLSDSSGEQSINCHKDFAQAKSEEVVGPPARPPEVSQAGRQAVLVFSLTAAITPFPRAMCMPAPADK